VPIAVRVGEHFTGDPVVRDGGSIERFVVLGPSGEVAVPGVDGTDPAGVIRVSAPGLYIVGFRSPPTPVELAPDLFEKYLEEERLEHVIAARRQQGRSLVAGREIFSRCAKAIVVTAGSQGAAGQDRPLGFRLELVPEPGAAPGADSDAGFRLLSENKPLPGALVTAIHREDRLKGLARRTDKNGRVAFPLRAGTWLVKAVHMIPAPATSGADWESLWASLTFER